MTPKKAQGTEHRQDKAPKVEAGNGSKAEKRTQEPTHDRASDAKKDRYHDPSGIGTRHDPLGEYSDYKAENDPRENSHRISSTLCGLTDRH
jgi:hypothetical protein